MSRIPATIFAVPAISMQLGMTMTTTGGITGTSRVRARVQH